MYNDYLNRLQAHYERLDNLHVHYRLPDFKGLTEQNVFINQAVINLQPPLKNSSIHYTLDGSRPTLQSPALTQPLVIKQSSNIKLAAFRADGSAGDIYNLHYTRQNYAEPVKTGATSNGLTCAYYPGSYKSSKLMAKAQPAQTFTADSVTVPAGVNAPSFGLVYKGYLNISADGIYSFYLTCDDGGILNIANRQVVDNDGWHGPLEKSGQAALKKGLQPIELDFVEGGGGYTLKLKYSINGSEPIPVPSGWLKHK